MQGIYDEFTFAGAFPPRTVAFCRAAALAILSALGMAALGLALAALLTLNSPRPGFAQTPQSRIESAPAGLFFHVGRAIPGPEAGSQ